MLAFRSFTRFLLVGTFCALIVGDFGRAFGQFDITDLYYDTNGSGAGIGSHNNSGTWNLTNTNWNTSPFGTDAPSSWSNLPASSFVPVTAYFGGVGASVTLGADISASDINILSNGYTFDVNATSNRTVQGSWILGNAPNGIGTSFRAIGGNRELTIHRVLTQTGAAVGSLNVHTDNFFRINLNSLQITTNPVVAGSISVPINITGTGNANFVGIGTAMSSTISGAITGNSQTLHFGATSGNTLTFNVVNNGSGSVQFGVGSSGGGGGTVVLGTGAKTWGNTDINLGTGGVVRLTGSTLPTGTNLSFLSNSTLQTIGRNVSVSSLTSAGGVGAITNTHASTATTLTINGNAATTYTGSISNGGVGVINLVRSGSGSTTLSGTNTYTGSTTVSGGLLVIDGTHTGGGATTVNGGELVVNGSLAATSFNVNAPGTVSGNGSITTADLNVNGKISPGSSIGSMAVNGNLNLNAGSTFEYELQTNGLNGDLIHVAGNLNITNGALLTVSDLAVNVPVLFGSKLTMISYTGSWNGGLLTFGSTQLANNDIFTVSGQEWRIRYNDSTGGANFAGNQAGANGFMTLTAVPEPSALLFVASALGIGFVRRRRS